MSTKFDDDTAKTIADIAGRNGFSAEAGRALAEALLRGGGTMAQFSHPDLGGGGQWSGGGMLMIGDMFNDELKTRVRSLAEALSEAIRGGRIQDGRAAASASGGGGGGASAAGGGAGGGAHWWPDTLGSPNTSGGQNDWRYAVFPDSGRLAVERGGKTTVYDTGDHRIHGVSQRQGSSASLEFTSQKGTVRVDDLAVVDGGKAGHGSHEGADSRPAAKGQAEAASPVPPDAPLGRNDGDVVETIRKLAALRESGILTEDEFSAKKAELLARL